MIHYHLPSTGGVRVVLSVVPSFCHRPSLQGGYAGNAAGMKISSLHKLTDIRSNKPGVNLLHYVAQQAEQTQPELLSLVEDLAVLEEASK